MLAPPAERERSAAQPVRNGGVEWGRSVRVEGDGGARCAACLGIDELRTGSRRGLPCLSARRRRAASRHSLRFRVQRLRTVIAPKAYERVAEKLRGDGYIVLFVDYLGRRGARNCSRGLITEGDAAKDLVAAVTWLRSQPAVDKARISALGRSYGGGAVLVALAENTEEQLGISRAVVYYPICRAVRPWRVATPVLMLLAGDDEVAPSTMTITSTNSTGHSKVGHEVGE